MGGLIATGGLNEVLKNCKNLTIKSAQEGEEECGLRGGVYVCWFFPWLWLMGGFVLGYLVLFGCVVVIFVRGVVAAVVRLVR
jgi:hypothetical protein